MKLSRIGEFGLIEILKRAERRSQRKETVVGIGDDCAVLEIPNSKSQTPNKSQIQKSKSQKLLLVTTDTFIENVHFRTKGLSFFALGQKALAANISDIAAMGGLPTHALVTIGLPKRINVEQVKQLYKGIDQLAKRYRIDIIGGDTISSPREVLISITLLGEVEKRKLLLRSTARVGDLICVTGKFGGPAARKFDIRRSKFETRLTESRLIAESKLANSMIDSSDGLVRSVIEICRASRVGARIREEMVPIAKAATLDQALYGGEEYELVFTISTNKVKRLEKLLDFKLVGEIVDRKQGIKLVDRHGKIKGLKSGGYEHFRWLGR